MAPSGTSQYNQNEIFFYSYGSTTEKKLCMFLNTPKVSRRHGELFRVRLIHWGWNSFSLGVVHNSWKVKIYQVSPNNCGSDSALLLLLLLLRAIVPVNAFLIQVKCSSSTECFEPFSSPILQKVCLLFSWSEKYFFFKVVYYVVVYTPKSVNYLL